MDLIVSVILVRKAQEAGTAATNQLREKRAAETASELQLMLMYVDILRSPGPLPLTQIW